MRPAEEVPFIKDDAYFVCADNARRSAMEEAQRASSDEERLTATLVVTNVWQGQLDHVTENMMLVLQAADPDPDRDAAVAWIGSWIDSSKKGFVQWGEYLNSFVDSYGRDRAVTLAEGPVKHRMEGINQAAKARILDRAEADGVDVSLLRAETGPSATKLCPDCAEDVKAAARKCRFCGYRFDTEIAG